MSCTLVREFVRKGHPLLFGCLFVVLAAVTSPAQTFSSLFSFNTGVGLDGEYPERIALIQGLDGNLYGTASQGGNGGDGVVFKISTSGAFSLVYTFCSQPGCTDGGEPFGGLVQTSNGNLYGTTMSGGAYGEGTVFKLTTGGTLTTLYSFCAQAGCPDGYSPPGTLILGSNGSFFGTTEYGGANGDGTVFTITPAGNLTTLHSFNGTDGFVPAGLIQAANGTFYGSTYQGGANGQGTIFKMTTAGAVTTLYNFCSLAGCADGANPNMAPTQGVDGNFYGVTNTSANSGGTFYKMTATGALKTLYTFCTLANCADGATPYGGLIQATNGKFYGTTYSGGKYGNGTIFKISSTGTETVLYSFCAQTNCADGANPFGGLLQDTNGTFYGTTYDGGSVGGGTALGTIFSLSDSLAAFVSESPSSGKVGAPVTILGTSLSGSTAVTFGGVAAKFTVNSTGSSISTTVPTGAETGSIQVTTPGGTLISNVIFKVTPRIASFTPSTGPVGTSVTITGVSLTQTSRVTFGGAAATSFTVTNDSTVTVTVPTGAKTGKIGITTPGGTATSTTSFTVTP